MTNVKKLMTVIIGGIVTASSSLSIAQTNVFELDDKDHRAGQAFERLDPDKNGFLTLDEILTPMLSKVKTKFSAIDTSDDGFIDLDEVIDHTNTINKVNAVFTYMDTDFDNLVSEEEYNASRSIHTTFSQTQSEQQSIEKTTTSNWSASSGSTGHQSVPAGKSTIKNNSGSGQVKVTIYDRDGLKVKSFKLSGGSSKRIKLRAEGGPYTAEFENNSSKDASGTIKS